MSFSPVTYRNVLTGLGVRKCNIEILDVLFNNKYVTPQFIQEALVSLNVEASYKLLYKLRDLGQCKQIRKGKRYGFEKGSSMFVITPAGIAVYENFLKEFALMEERVRHGYGAKG